MEQIPYKIYLEENEMPTAWYNVRADMKNKPAPLLNPGTGKPMTAEELEGVFCSELVQQELNNDDRLIPIPNAKTLALHEILASISNHTCDSYQIQKIDDESFSCPSSSSFNEFFLSIIK